MKKLNCSTWVAIAAAHTSVALGLATQGKTAGIFGAGANIVSAILAAFFAGAAGVEGKTKCRTKPANAFERVNDR